MSQGYSEPMSSCQNANLTQVDRCCLKTVLAMPVMARLAVVDAASLDQAALVIARDLSRALAKCEWDHHLGDQP